ncbi:MAG: RidA family protein [Variovorax paradoxus]|uniref:RidA family protein n=1 Tax=Variovorax paradoxus TaxID=34073 RepID=A0A2W5SM02_VARPD|nr:MAG: RidA family protein [Variovorax paradoxus]
MTTTRINPASMGGEPGSYSNGIKVEPAGAALYVAGQIGIDAKGIASPDFSEQAVQAWSNVKSILDEGGMTLKDIVKTTIYLTDPSDYAAFVKVRAEVLDGHKPASTLVYVSALVKPEWKVEIDVIASR